MQNGKCHVLGTFVSAKNAHCHHILPYNISKDNSFSNLVIIHKDVHKLIHAVKEDVINKYLKLLKLDKKMLEKLNVLRTKCNLEPINF